MNLRPLAAALLLVALLAGCNSPKSSHPGADQPAAERSDLWAFSAAGAVPQSTLPDSLRNWSVAWRSVDGRDAREPTLMVASDGTVFYAARDYSGGAGVPSAGTETPVMRTKDGGLTWTEVSGKLPTGDRNPPTSSDPMIYLDPWTQRLFQIEQVQTDCHWLVWSDDQGATWSSNPKGCVVPVADHQAIAAGPSRSNVPMPLYPDVVYVCTNQLVLGSGCLRSYDGGLTFATQTYAYPPVDAGDSACGGVMGGGIHGHVLVGPDGTVYLPREYCGEPFVAVSQDDGLTWTRRAVAGGIGSVWDPNMAFDADGTIYYLWEGADFLLHLTYSKDQGTTWSDPVLASPPGFTVSNLGAIAAGASGKIGYAFVGIRQPVPQNSTDDWTNITTDAFVGVSLDATNATPTFAVVKANPGNDPIYRGFCEAGRCGLMRDFIDATIAPDGSFYAAFVDACLRPDEPRAHADAGDCNTVAADYGEGNGNLGYMTRFVTGPDLGYPLPMN